MRHDFLFVSRSHSLQDFFYAFNLCNNFFQDYLHFAVCLHDFFFSDVMAARIFFQAFFFARIFWGEFSPTLPGISNGPPLTFICWSSVWTLTFELQYMRDFPWYTVYPWVSIILWISWLLIWNLFVPKNVIFSLLFDIAPWLLSLDKQ